MSDLSPNSGGLQSFCVSTVYKDDDGKYNYVVVIDSVTHGNDYAFNTYHGARTAMLTVVDKQLRQAFPSQSPFTE